MGVIGGRLCRWAWMGCFVLWGAVYDPGAPDIALPNLCSLTKQLLSTYFVAALGSLWTNQGEYCEAMHHKAQASRSHKTLIPPPSGCVASDMWPPRLSFPFVIHAVGPKNNLLQACAALKASDTCPAWRLTHIRCPQNGSYCHHHDYHHIFLFAKLLLN